MPLGYESQARRTTFFLSKKILNPVREGVGRIFSGFRVERGRKGFFYDRLGMRGRGGRERGKGKGKGGGLGWVFGFLRVLLLGYNSWHIDRLWDIRNMGGKGFG